MARPTKQGVDYFPLDVYMDDKFKFIEIKYKLEGFAIVIKLMQRIYSQGYWCKWSEDEQLLFCDENKIDPALLENVFLECLKRGVFHEGLYLKYSILTSKGIQKRYKEMIRRRKDVEWIADYLLIDDKNRVNDDINPSLSSHNDGKSTQSKQNKTKQENTKQNNNINTVNPFDFYQQNFGVLNSFISQDIDAWINDLNEELVIEAMKISLQSQKPWKYAVGILKDWHNHNIKTLDQVAAHNKQFGNKGRNNGTAKQDPYKDQYISELGF